MVMLRSGLKWDRQDAGIPLIFRPLEQKKKIVMKTYTDRSWGSGA
jgi:hypothetical protein